jgi:hypothetical protein
MQTDVVLGVAFEASASPVIGSVEVLEPSPVLQAAGGFGLLGDVGLDLAVFKHGFDHQVATGQQAVIEWWR